ncbi:MAG: GGDEF domain-containing protein [Acidobacteriota bacterium]|jgi:diguanylate cyclase (GGDEF)-like protein|nr:GGDEF domain-containing protein [Acidobacteriota bacterium]
MKVQKRLQRDARPALIFLTGELLAVPIPLEREEVILGRAMEADVRINDTGVARRHARINTIFDGEKNTTVYVLTNLDSGKGTILNNQKITQEILHNGDKIIVGDHILRFELLDEIDREYQRRIRRLVSHDDLTGLLSSRSFFSELRRESALAKQDNRPFCVLMMDVDFFKIVNDTFGHLIGSKILEEIGMCITRCLRSGDVAARFGGEEFAAFLLEAELAQGLVAAERIRAEIENYQFSNISRLQNIATEKHPVTISIGVVSFPNDSKDPIELIEMADSALYRAKREGRNRVCAFRDSAAEETNKPFASRRP